MACLKKLSKKITRETAVELIKSIPVEQTFFINPRFSKDSNPIDGILDIVEGRFDDGFEQSIIVFDIEPTQKEKEELSRNELTSIFLRVTLKVMRNTEENEWKNEGLIFCAYFLRVRKLSGEVYSSVPEALEPELATKSLASFIINNIDVFSLMVNFENP